ncbi:MAG TPA: TonB-dependent receptor [Woeseiaceae bacterium]|nr:TonB-dependent receptor [Woeseiaceae bacterium]
MKYRTLLTALALPSALASANFAVASGPAPSTGSGPPPDEIVVVGTETDEESLRREVAITPGGIDLVDVEDFRNRNVSSLADVLQYVPGVWSSSESGNDVIFFSSRGSNLDATDYDMNGIKLLKDGLPITTADGNNHNRVIDPLSARHITVVRGANALKFGASTLGGAANFVSATARNSDSASMLLSGGSFGQWRERIMLSDRFGPALDALVTVESKQWNGYRDHNEQNRTGVYGNAGWRVSDTLHTRFYGSWIENDQQLPGSLTRAQVAADPSQANADASGGNYQLDVDSWRLANKTTWQIGDERQLEIGLSVEEQALFHPIVDRVMADVDGPGPAPPVEVFSLLIDTDHRNTAAVLRYSRHAGAHDLLAGFDLAYSSVAGAHYRNLGGMRNGRTALIDDDATLREAFAMDRWSLGERTMLVLAAQAVATSRDVRSTDVETGALRNPAGDYSSINPRIGLLYDLRPDLRLYGNVSRLYEPPTNFELEDNVAGGEALLDAMSGTVIEIGARGSRELRGANRWSWTLSAYYARIEDEILSVDDPVAPGTSLSTNIDRTLHAGIEASARGRLVLDHATDRSLEPVISISLNRFRFDGDAHYGDHRLPAAPDYVVRGEIMYRDGNGLWLGPTFELVGDRYADFANSYRVDGYSLVGMRGGWSGDTWSVFAEAGNLLDAQYIANHAVRDIAAPDEAILNPGAPLSAYVGIRWRLR